MRQRGGLRSIVLFFIFATSIPLECFGTTPPYPVEILRLTGPSSDGLFGAWPSTAGDMNGDGHEDIVVGAPGSPAPGNVYVYFGARPPDSTSDLTIAGEQNTARFGVSAISAGDFNSDGFDDIAVISNGFGDPMYLYFGGQNPNNQPDLTFSSPSIYYRFSQVVSADVNNDGYTDLVAGLSGLSSPSRVLIYFGGPTADATSDLELKYPASGLYGNVASTDFNHDHVSDVVAGSGDGILLFYGGALMDSLPALRLTGRTIDGQFVSGFGGAGDVNGDGASDIIVATRNGTTGLGQAYIYFGGASPDTVPGIRLGSPPAVTDFGESFVGLGDLNGDGFSDLIIGASVNQGLGGGRVFLYFGGSPMDSTPDAETAGGVALSGFGSALGAADLNGDGVPDALVGVPGPQGSPGTVLVYDYSTPLPCTAAPLGGSRTISLANGPFPLRLRVEPGTAFMAADIDRSTIRLRSANTGEAVEISAAAITESQDNGLTVLTVSFDRTSLRRLFTNVTGTTTIATEFVGSLMSTRKFAATVPITIAGLPVRRHWIMSTVSPNPMNPTGTLEFVTEAAGRVAVRIYDVAGRLKRAEVMESLPPGVHEVQIVPRDRNGTLMPTGVYFYIIDAAEGIGRGRLLITK